MIDWTQIVTMVRAELEVAGEGPDWIAARLPGGARVVKLRQRQVNGQPWVQLLVAVLPARSATLFAVLQDSAARVVGAPAIDEGTLVLREALSQKTATWTGIQQLAAVLQHEADRLARQLRAPAELTDLATNFAE